MEIQISDIIRILPFLLPFVISALFLTPGVITFFTSQKHERMFLNKELQILYRILVIGFFFFLVPISVTDESIANENWLYTFFNEKILYIFALLILGFVASIFFNKKMTYFTSEQFRESIKEKKIHTILPFILLYLTTIFIYIFPLGILYGYFIHSSLEQPVEIAISNIAIISSLYYFMLIFVFKALDKLFYQNTQVKIRLKNGDTIMRAYLLHPTYKKRVLVGDNPDKMYCTKQIAVSNESIEYIEFEIEHDKKRKIGFMENKIYILKKK